MNLDLEAERQKLLALIDSVVPKDFLEKISISSEAYSSLKTNEPTYDIMKMDI